MIANEIYQPLRDAPVQGVFPRELCGRLLTASNTEWCEIFVPPKDIRDYGDNAQWPSFVADTERMFYIPTDRNYNILSMNENARLSLCYKTLDETRKIIGREPSTTEEILARILQYEAVKAKRFTTGNNCQAIYEMYLASGKTMYNYIRSLY